jgi:hypothetical protein
MMSMDSTSPSIHSVLAFAISSFSLEAFSFATESGSRLKFLSSYLPFG